MGLSGPEIQALVLSLEVAVAAVALSLPFGVACAWLLARKQFAGKAVVETLLNLPLVLPPVVTGYVLLVTFGRSGWLGGMLYSVLGIEFVFNWKGAALASAVVAFPLMVRAMRVAFTTVDSRLEGAARTLGAGPWDCFFSVTLPLARHGLIAGCVLAFARSLGEFGATIMIAGNMPGETQTMPLYIYDQLNTGDLAHTRGILVASVVIAMTALAASEWFLRREQRMLGLGGAGGAGTDGGAIAGGEAAP
ncbi:MAG TPA: molybdate ABC transporter permease subunit [Planctomycetota bacterium]|nr:molybdate ABC transporter permease subunit [Planctomycetota bacterium]